MYLKVYFHILLKMYMRIPHKDLVCAHVCVHADEAWIGPTGPVP